MNRSRMFLCCAWRPTRNSTPVNTSTTDANKLGVAPGAKPLVPSCWRERRKREPGGKAAKDDAAKHRVIGSDGYWDTHAENKRESGK